MMIATWSGPRWTGKVLRIAKSFRTKKVARLRFAGGADQRLHVIQIALERPATRRREPVLGLGRASRERLGAQHVLRLFELARVHAQIAVAGLEQGLEVGE